MCVPAVAAAVGQQSATLRKSVLEKIILKIISTMKATCSRNSFTKHIAEDVINIPKVG